MGARRGNEGVWDGGAVWSVCGSCPPVWITILVRCQRSESLRGGRGSEGRSKTRREKRQRERKAPLPEGARLTSRPAPRGGWRTQGQRRRRRRATLLCASLSGHSQEHDGAAGRPEAGPRARAPSEKRSRHGQYARFRRSVEALRARWVGWGGLGGRLSTSSAAERRLSAQRCGARVQLAGVRQPVRLGPGASAGPARPCTPAFACARHSVPASAGRRDLSWLLPASQRCCVLVRVRRARPERHPQPLQLLPRGATLDRLACLSLRGVREGRVDCLFAVASNVQQL